VGTFVLVPGGTTHDFENRSDAPAAVFTIATPGNFERSMPAIVDWFRDHPQGRRLSRTAQTCSPRTVMIRSGADSSASTRERRRLMWTSRVLVSPT
jgi:hypothetical protein